MSRVQGEVKIVLNKPFYVAGEVIQGTAEIDLRTPAPASSLKIKFAGFERTLIENTVVDPQTHESKTMKYKDEKTFFKQESVLYVINTVLSPGHYSYPFSYPLPAGLPGIFYDERREWDHDKVKGAIIYKVKVFLDVPGKDLKEKSFLFAKGKLKMDYWIDRNVFQPGEVVNVRIAVDNESTKTVDHLKVKLMRDLRIKAKHMTKYISEEVGRETWPGVKEKSKADAIFQFRLNPNVFPTTVGHLVQCQYHLDIECDVPMAIDLEHHVPITIVLMPTGAMPINLYASYTPHAW